MAVARKYIRQCRSLFPVYGKLERTFLKRLKVQVDEHLELFPSSSYEELLEQFGTPREVVLEYYNTIDDDYLLRKTNLVKKIKVFLIFSATLLFIYCFYQRYTTYQALNLIKDQQIIYEKEGKIEEIK